MQLVAGIKRISTPKNEDGVDLQITFQCILTEENLGALYELQEMELRHAQVMVEVEPCQKELAFDAGTKKGGRHGEGEGK